MYIVFIILLHFKFSTTSIQTFLLFFTFYHILNIKKSAYAQLLVISNERLSTILFLLFYHILDFSNGRILFFPFYHIQNTSNVCILTFSLFILFHLIFSFIHFFLFFYFITFHIFKCHHMYILLLFSFHYIFNLEKSA